MDRGAKEWPVDKKGSGSKEWPDEKY